MKHWTSPRAYIISMTASQTAALYRDDKRRLDDIYAEHVAKLSSNFGNVPL